MRTVPYTEPAAKYDLDDPRYWRYLHYAYSHDLEDRTGPVDWTAAEREAGLRDPVKDQELSEDLKDLDLLAQGLQPARRSARLSKEEELYRRSVLASYAQEFAAAFDRAEPQEAARLARISAEAAETRREEIGFCVAAFFCDLIACLAA